MRAPPAVVPASLLIAACLAGVGRRDRAVPSDDGRIGPDRAHCSATAAHLTPVRRDDHGRPVPDRRRGDAQRPLLLDGLDRAAAPTTCASSRCAPARSLQTLPPARRLGRHRDGPAAPARLRLGRRRLQATSDQQSPAGTPGIDGDVVHVFSYSTRFGRARRSSADPGAAAVRRAGAAGLPADERGKKVAWPDRLAVSPDGKHAARAAQPRRRRGDRRRRQRRGALRQDRQLPLRRGDPARRQDRAGLQRDAGHGVGRSTSTRRKKTKDIQVGAHLSHPEAIAVDPQGDRARTCRWPTPTRSPCIDTKAS